MKHRNGLFVKLQHYSNTGTAYIPHRKTNNMKKAQKRTVLKLNWSESVNKIELRCLY